MAARKTSTTLHDVRSLSAPQLRRLREQLDKELRAAEGSGVRTLRLLQLVGAVNALLEQMTTAKSKASLHIVATDVSQTPVPSKPILLTAGLVSDLLLYLDNIGTA